MTPDLRRGDVTPLFKTPAKPKPKWGKPLASKSAKKRDAMPAYIAFCEEVAMRSHGDCEIRSTVCTGRGEQVHHVRRRSQGGKDTLDNVRHTCRACHRYLHANIEEAAVNGWLKLRKVPERGSVSNETADLMFLGFLVGLVVSLVIGLGVRSDYPPEPQPVTSQTVAPPVTIDLGEPAP